MNSVLPQCLSPSIQARILFWFRAILVASLLLPRLSGAQVPQAAREVSIVDLLVVYTPAAREGAGGVSAIELLARQAVTEANTVLQKSLVDARLRLVKVCEVGYAESGSVSNDLQRLRKSGDGFLDEVQTLRNQCGADLVCLVTETGEDWWFYGLQGPSAENAYSVIRRQFLVGSYYFPVTLSFNFGCQSDRSHADSVGAFPYAYGWVFEGSDRKTYSTVEGFSGERLPFFSNPRISHKGKSAGMPAGQPFAADNSRVLNLTAPIVAAFRGETNRTIPPSVSLISPTNDAILSAAGPLRCLATASDSDGRIVRVDFYANGALLGSSVSPPFQLKCSDLLPGRYTLMAVAVDDAGVQSVSEPARIFWRPPNDNFADRQIISGYGVVLTNSNDLATTEPEEPDPGSGSGIASLWWSWTAPESGYATISINCLVTNSGCNRRLLDVYSGDSLTNLVRLASSPDEQDPPVVQFPVIAGRTYAIAACSSDSPEASAWTTGPFQLQLRLSTLRLETPLEGQRFTGPADIPIALSTGSNGGLARAGFYADGVLLGTVSQEPWSFVWTNVPLGVHSVQVVATNADGEGLRLTPVQINVHPVNDDFESRILLEGTEFSIPVSNLGASLEPGEVPINRGHTIWWTWTAPSNGSLKIWADEIDFFLGMRLSTGSSLDELQTVMERTFLYPWLGYPSVLGGRTYQIALDDYGYGYEWGPGPFTFNLKFVPSPINDYLGDRIVLTNSSIVVTGTGSGATSDPGVPEDDGKIWFSWIAPGDGTMMASLEGGPAVPSAVLYTGTSGANLTPAGRMNPASGRPATTIEVQRGGEYFIGIASYGDYKLDIEFADYGTNDDFSQRLQISGLNATNRVSNSKATVELGEPNHAGSTAGKSLWWTWTAPVTGNVTINAAGTSFGPAMAVYTGDSISSLIQVAADSVHSELNFDAVAGRTYQIAMGATSSGTEIRQGYCEFRLNQVPAPPAPANDRFADRIVITGNEFTLISTNDGATAEPGEPSHAGCPNHSTWWTWIAPASGRLNVTRLGGNPTAALAVYSGSSLSNLDALALLGVQDQQTRFNVEEGKSYEFALNTCVAKGGEASFELLLSTVCLVSPTNGAKFIIPGPITLQAGATPLDGIITNVDFLANGILVGSAPSDPFTFVWTNIASGRYSLEVRATGVDGQYRWSKPVDIRVVPANDDFDNRLLISGHRVSLSLNSSGATREPGEPVARASNAGGATVWLTWTPAWNGRVYMTEWWSSYLAFATLYTGDSISNLSLVPYEPASDLTPRTLVADVIAGVPYHIALDGALEPEDGPDGILAFNLFFQPVDDLFASRTVLTGTNATWHSWTYLASMEPHEPNPPGWTRNGRTVWATWVAPVDGDVLLSLNTGVTSGGNSLSVYRGNSLESLVRPEDQRQNAGAYGTELTFRATAGVAYQICFGNDETELPSSGVEFDMALHVTPAPANDRFAQRAILNGPSARETTILVAASPESDEPAHAGIAASHSAWWSWTAPANGRAAITAGNSNQAPCRVAIYTGDSLGALSPVATNDPGLIPASISGWFAGEFVSFNAVAGTTYQLALDTSVSTDVPFTIELNLSRAELITPADGSMVFAPTNLAFSARVSELVPVVTQVVFHAVADGIGTSFTGTASAPPFDLGWTNPVPGSYSIVTVATDASGQTSCSAPVQLVVELSNDSFSQALGLDGLKARASGFIQGATTEPDEVAAPGGMGSTVWWSWVAPTNGWVTITDTAESHDPANGPLISVFTGSCVSNLTQVASNSYTGVPIFPGFPEDWLAGPSLKFYALAGTNYWVSVDGINEPKLTINLLLEMAKAQLVEPLDGSVFFGQTNVFLRADTIDLNGVVKRVDFYDGTNFLATVTNRPFEFLWLSTPPGMHALTAVAVDEFGLTSTSAPVSFRVSVGNDDFANRFLLDGTNIPVDAANLYATSEPGETNIGGWPDMWGGLIEFPPTPFVEFGAGKTLWWTWVAPGDGLLTIEVQGATNLVLVSILGGDSIENLTRLAHNGFARCNECWGCAKSSREQARLSVTNGQVCHIALDVLESAFAGQHQFELRFWPSPANDNFAGRFSLSGASLLFQATNWAAGSQASEPNLKGNGPTNSVWFSWTAPLSGRVTLGTNSSEETTFPDSITSLSVVIEHPDPCSYTWDDPPAPTDLKPFFSVFRGNDLTNLTTVATGSLATFEAAAGVTYLIAIDGQDGSMGSSPVWLSLLPRPANDDFADATPLSGLNPALIGYNTGASREFGESLAMDPSQGRSVWWSWTAPASGTVHIGDTWDFCLGVFVGTNVSELLPVARGSGGVDFYAHQGTTYHIAVTDLYGSEGAFNLALSGLLPSARIATGPTARLPDGRFQLSVEGATGQSLAIQASTNLVDWETLAVDTILGGQVLFVDNGAAGSPQRFYRVMPLESLAQGAPLQTRLMPLASGGGVRVQISGEPGQPFRLRASSDLIHWVELTRNWISGDSADFLDTDAATLPFRFYETAPLP